MNKEYLDAVYNLYGHKGIENVKRKWCSNFRKGMKMLFIDAIKALQDGMTVTRAGWLESEGYLIFLPGMKNVWKITAMPSVNAGNHLFSVEDYLADDWQVGNGANVIVNTEEGA